MRRLVAKGTWLVMIGVVGLFATAIVAFGWGVAKTWSLADRLIDEGASSNVSLVTLLEAIDIYLTATVLVILAIGLFELFIADVELPQWLVIDSLDDLKGKLIDVLVIILAIKFIEKLVASKEPLDVLWYGLAVTAVGGLLVGVTLAKRKK